MYEGQRPAGLSEGGVPDRCLVPGSTSCSWQSQDWSEEAAGLADFGVACEHFRLPLLPQFGERESDCVGPACEPLRLNLRIDPLQQTRVHADCDFLLPHALGLGWVNLSPGMTITYCSWGLIADRPKLPSRVLGDEAGVPLRVLRSRIQS